MSRVRKGCGVRDCEEGSVAVEFAIVAFIFILLVLGIIEFGRAINIRNDLARAVDAGVRRAYVKPPQDPNAFNAALETAIQDAFISHGAVTVSSPTQETISGRTYVTITATYQFRFLLTGLFGNGFPLTVERRTPI